MYLGDGRGAWQIAARELYPVHVEPGTAKPDDHLGTEDVDVADVNGDGFLDLVTCATESVGIGLYLGDGTGAGWTLTDSGFAHGRMGQSRHADRHQR